MKNIAIIYHDADFDGKLSNEVCRFHLARLHPEAAIHSYGWDYGRPVPELEYGLADGLGMRTQLQWTDYDALYIVDLSVDELMARPELRSNIVWIDHHKSAIEKWDQLADIGDKPFPYFNGLRIDGVAACRLCWQWFDCLRCYIPGPIDTKQDFINRYVDEPALIRLVGEYDIWDHRDPDAKALQFGLRSLSDKEYRFLVESQFFSEDGKGDGSEPLIAAIAKGYAIKSYCDKQNDEYSAQYSHTIKFAGLTMCALNISQRGNSDLVRGGLKPEHQAIFAWRYTGNVEQPVMVSLYHAPGHEDIDLSKIATQWGGGGHKGACGFRVRLIGLDSILDGLYNSDGGDK
jgi:hypothetical protein